MLHAFATEDFLNAVDEFDRHARQGTRAGSGNSCGKQGPLPGTVVSYAARGVGFQVPRLEGVWRVWGLPDAPWPRIVFEARRG